MNTPIEALCQEENGDEVLCLWFESVVIAHLLQVILRCEKVSGKLRNSLQKWGINSYLFYVRFIR